MARKGNNIYHRADGRWEGRCYRSGSRKYKSVYGKSYTEVKEKLNRLRNEVLVPSSRCSLLVTDILKMRLESCRPAIKESSYASYRHKMEKYLIPYFGGLKYNNLDSARISAFISEKLAEGLSPKYISDMVIMLKSAAKWAELQHNYANLIQNVKLPKKRARETSVFTPTQQRKLLSAIQNSRDNTACGVMLTMFTGMRIGEVCALRWSDIDFDAKILHVTKTVQRIPVYGAERKTAVMVTSPKSSFSVRDIPLPAFLMEMLSRYRGRDCEYLISGGESLVEPRCFVNRYKALLKKADVPSLKFHSLRHTFATNALQQCFDIKTLSELLGHASAGVTMTVYVHSSMERKSACMNRLQPLC